MHAEVDSKSSDSPVNSSNRVIKFKKRPNARVIPRTPPSDSDASSSGVDSEQDLLPDLYNYP